MKVPYKPPLDISAGQPEPYPPGRPKTLLEIETELVAQMEAARLLAGRMSRLTAHLHGTDPKEIDVGPPLVNLPSPLARMQQVAAELEQLLLVADTRLGQVEEMLLGSNMEFESWDTP